MESPVMGRLDVSKYVLGRFLAHPGQAGQSPVSYDLLQLGDRGDAKLFPQPYGGLWSYTRHMHEVQNALRELGPQPLVVLQMAGGHQFSYLVGDGLAYPRKLLYISVLSYDLVQLRGEVVDGAGRPLICADCEDRLAFHLQEASDVFEYPGDIWIVHIPATRLQ